MRDDDVAEIIVKYRIKKEMPSISWKDKKTFTEINRGRMFLFSRGLRSIYTEALSFFKIRDINDFKILFIAFRPTIEGSDGIKQLFKRIGEKQTGKVIVQSNILDKKEIQEILKNTYGEYIFHEQRIDIIKSLTGWDLKKARQFRYNLVPVNITPVYKQEFFNALKSSGHSNLIPSILTLFSQSDFPHLGGSSGAHWNSRISYLMTYLRVHRYPIYYKLKSEVSSAHEKWLKKLLKTIEAQQKENKQFI